jgi:uncharacterized 2Fe-2S/4Fe-4S cluster protein (DUF4445 family)
MEKKCHKRPWLTIVTPEIRPPSLRDNRADVDRVLKAIKKEVRAEHVQVDLSLVKRMPGILRECGFHIEAVLFENQEGWHIIDLFPLRGKSSIYGLAVDLGTSTVVVRLLELLEGETKDETSFHNPQIEIGPDILARIHYASEEGGLERLHGLIMGRLNEEVDGLIKRNGIRADRVVGASVAGNTTMAHLFLGLNPYWLCREPYIPVTNRPDLVKSGELGLPINTGAPVLVFPNAGSYFGGDLIAGVLASGMMNSDAVSCLVDVGTNAEVVIGNREWLMACAGAAGPALEGGVASMGMMAGPGVIDKVVIDPHTITIKIGTIDDLLPIGICGSGLIDLVAQLFLAGMIDLRGKFVAEKCRDRLTDIEGIWHLIVVPSEESGTGKDLTLSQPDIDALMRSKAAMYTILTTITTALNIPFNKLARFYMAGTFGTFIDPRSAITIGMIPDLPLETYVPLGNSSLEGASMALLSAHARDEVFRIRDGITYMELNVNQEFMNLFSAAKFIPHTDRSLFPSVKDEGTWNS